jgi:hypothetical protein
MIVQPVASKATGRTISGGGDFDPNRGGDGGNVKEGGQNEQTRR